jgi:hypothetical protein
MNDYLEEILLGQVGNMAGIQMDSVRVAAKKLEEMPAAMPASFLLGMNGPNRGAIFEFPYLLLTEQADALVRARKTPKDELCEALSLALCQWEDDPDNETRLWTNVILMWCLWEKLGKTVPEGETLILFGYSAPMFSGNQALFFYGGSK